jgi:hypothetical protein
MASTSWCSYSISTKKSSTFEPKVWWTISPQKIVEKPSNPQITISPQNSQQLDVDGFQGLVGHETSFVVALVKLNK